MPFRDEIIRGARLAAVAFAVLLGSLIAYRMQQHPAPAAIAPAVTQQEEAPPPILAPPAPVPPIPAPAEKQAARVVADTRVPPPPSKVSARRNPGKAVVAPQPVMKVIEVVPVAVAEAPPAPPVETAPVVVAAAPTPAAVVPAPAAASAEDDAKAAPAHDEAAPKTGNSPRRVVKAVGRFLHIGGKKDAAPQTDR